MKNSTLKIIYSGLIAGFISEGILGALFVFPPVQSILYNPNWQGKSLFISSPQGLISE